ncbi:MAG TPA: hypothetical protein VLC73_05635 [Burkholderiales bacterium]|nr:hypothetical protein [Burkholderiales bacterium]
MPDWLKRLVLLVTLLAMPLQGATATLSVLNCHGDAQAHALHSPQVPDHAAHTGDHPEGTGTSGVPGHHACCGHVVSAPPLATFSRAHPDSPIRVSSPDLWRDLFVPDLPHRPPLA